MDKRVVAIGIDPTAVDPRAFADFSPQQVRQFIEAQLQVVRDAGYELVSCLLDPGQPVRPMLLPALQARPVDCVLIGAGLRDAAQLRLFEDVINIVHQFVPEARVCFNTHPADTIDAVRRCMDQRRRPA